MISLIPCFFRFPLYVQHPEHHLYTKSEPRVLYIDSMRLPWTIFPQHGSVMWLLCHVIMPDTPERNLAALWGEIQRLYVRFGIANRYSGMRMTMFKTSSQPKMKGKAAELRDLGKVMVELWRQHANLDLHINMEILAILQGSAHMDQILTDNHDFVLPREASTDLLATCHLTLATWYQVFLHFKNSEMTKPLFGLTAKAHFMLHACVMSISEVSPRHMWCYSGEDFMSKVRPLCASSAAGNAMWQVTAKATEKYWRALDMTLRDPDLWLRNL